MFRRLFANRKGRWQLGIQFLPYAIRMAEVRYGDTGIEVRRQTTIPADTKILENNQIYDPDWVSFELEKKVNEWRCKGRDTILSVPLSIVVIRKMQIPNVPEKAIRDLVEVEIENTLHLPFQSPVFDYVTLENEAGITPEAQPLAKEDEENKKQEKLNLLIVAAPSDTVQGYVDVLKKAGLKPVAADIEPLALYRLQEQAAKEINGSGVLLLHVTLNGVNVSIFSEGIPEFVRHISLAMPFYDETNIFQSLQFSKQAARRLHETGEFNGYANDLVSEVNRIMSFYQYSMHEGQRRIRQIFLTGEVGDIRHIADYLQERISSIPIHVSSHTGIESTEEEYAPYGYFVAVGLGMKEITLI